MKQPRQWSIVLLMALLGCVPSFGPGRPTRPEGLRPAVDQRVTKLAAARDRGAPLIDDRAGNCPVNEVEIPGEGYRVKGGVGGMVVAPNPVGVAPGDPLAVGKQIFAQAAPGLTKQAAVIVVDDFNGDGRRPGVYFLDQQDGPTLADLRGGTTRRELAALEAAVRALGASGQYSHGALVFNHTLALLSAADPNPELSGVRVAVPEEDAVVSVPTVIFPRLGVTVAALDTQSFNTEVIGGRLQATIRALAAQGGISRFAVNLSFGLVPCSVLADVEAVRRPGLTFEAYQQEVLDANGLDANAFRDDLVNILTTPVGTDPLLRGAETDPLRLGAATVSYLAAAGNYGLPYALFPGYWSEFAAVSAQNLAATGAPVKDPDYSNTGEVLLPGGYYTLTAYDPATGGFVSYPDLRVAGTSFAAPVLSVFTALDFTSATPRCGTTDPVSPLAFFKTDPPVPTPLPALDLPLPDALGRYCPGP